MELPESPLADHEVFADWRAITNRTLTFYSRSIELLAQYTPVAKEWLDNFRQTTDARRYRALTDPLVRIVINDAMTLLKGESFESISAVERTLEASILHLRNERELTPGAAAVATDSCCTLGPNATRVWSGQASGNDVDDLLSARFQSLFEAEIATSMSDRPVALVAPNEKEAEILQEGGKLLSRLLPAVSHNVLRFVHLVALTDVCATEDGKKPMYLSASASSNRIPGTVFITPAALSSPADAAEALLHEACHKLLHDVILTRPILRSGYSPKQSPTITAIWNQSFPWNPNQWPIDRGILALHVYVHLALFFKTLCEDHANLELDAGDAPSVSTPRVWRRVAFDRARYLLRHITTSAGDELGPAGVTLLDWLQDSLVKIDPSPPEVETLAPSLIES